MNQQQKEEQQREKYYSKLKKIQKYPTIRKCGLFKESQTKLILHIVHQGEVNFPGDIERQCDLIVKMVEQELGKIYQLFIFQRAADEGHSLYSIQGKYVTIEYKDYVYLLWQILLEEDPNK